MLIRNGRVLALLTLAISCLVVPGSRAVAERATAPVDSVARDVAKRLVAGSDFTCLLDSNGAIRCWGQNDVGQLGNGDASVTRSLAPVLVVGITNAVEISAYARHACALLRDGTAKCWGFGADGQLGDGVAYGTSSPTFIPAFTATPVTVKNPAGSAALSGLRTIGTGTEHSCAVRDSDGAVFCWGDEQSGHLGNGLTASLRLLPVQVETSSGFLTGIVDLAVGRETSCGLSAVGAAFCWGGNQFGQLANPLLINTSVNPNTFYPALEATQWGNVTGLRGIGIGGQHICAFTSSAVVCAGGTDTQREFSNTERKTSLWFYPESGAQQVALTKSATCILTSSNTVKCAGHINVAGYNNVWVNDLGPTGMFVNGELSDVRGVAAGEEHLCAYRDNGITCWGANNNGQLGDGTVVHPKTFTQVAASLNSSVSIVDPGAKDVSSPPFTLSASATSGATVSFGVDSSSSAVCSATVGGVVTVLGAGNCVVTATAPVYGLYLDSSTSRTMVFSALEPVVTAGDPSSVGFTTATVSATVSARGSESATTLRYGTSSLLGVGTDVAIGSQSGIAAQAITHELTSLSPGITYYYRFTSTNALGTATSLVGTFTTKGAKPTVTTGGATAQVFEASVTAEVNANDVDATVSFEYGTDPQLANASTAKVSDAVTGSTAKSVSVSLTKLAAGTVYYFRVLGSNAVGSSAGDIKSFTTRGGKPTVVTGSATRGASGMTVNGKVNAKELETSVRFEYGTDPKLTGAQQTTAKTQTGTDDVDVSAVITGLAENTTYYYRITATNAVGSAEGDIKSFTTTRPEGVSINDGEEFTASENVVVSVVGSATAVKAILSNDGGFKTSETFDLINNSADIPWKLQSSREGTFTKIVYVKYVSRFGSQSQAQTDDIILDTTKPVLANATAVAAAPTGSAVQVLRISAKAKASGGVRMSLRGSDTISGIGTIEVRSAANKPATKVKVSRVDGKADGKPRAAAQTVTLKTTAKRLQVRVIDRAGNASAWRTITVK